MKRRSGRNSTISRASRKYRKAHGAPQAVFRKHCAVEWLEKRVVLSATPTSIAVIASSNSVVYGQPVTLTADVSAPLGFPAEGTVDFFNNGAPLGTGQASAGVATLADVRLPAGADLITASYSDPGGAFASSSTVVGPQSTIETVAGGALPSGLPAVDASISPQAVAVDSSGDLFIADNTLNVVFEVNHATGVAATVAGNGTAGFSGDSGPATAAELNDPAGVAVDSSGHLFIADRGNERIREVELATGAINTVAGNGSFVFSGDGGPATAAGIGIGPAGIAIDSSGDLFIADMNHRIREVNHATGIITTVAGNGTGSFSGDGGPATAAGLGQPGGIAIDSSGDLFVAVDNRIREVDHATGVITTVAGNGTGGFSGDGGPATAAALSLPWGVAVDSSGDLFISDLGARVREVSHATGIITTVAGNGTYGFRGDGGPASDAELNTTEGVAVDSSGDLFIADANNRRVRKVDLATGVITTAAGNGTQAFSGDAGPATAAEVDSPKNIAIDPSGDIFIADAANNRIREVNQATGVITTIAGTGTAGYSGDGGLATAAELHSPQGIAVDSSGHLFIADSLNDCIREVDLTTGVITTVAGYGAYGFSGDGGLATAAELSYPQGIAVDSSGHLFIADWSNHRIRQVDLATGIITTVAGNGASGFAGDGGPATAAELSGPEGIAVDSLGRLFIADGGNERIREVNLATGVITTVAGNGIQGFSGDGGPATAASIHDAEGVAVDSSGHLFIAVRGNNRIREVNLATGVITTAAGNGTQGFSGDGGPAGAAELSGPAGVAVDSSGDLFIADTGGNRVREVLSGGAGVGPQSTIKTVAGGALQSGLPTVDASISPQAVAIDSSGDLFIADNTLNVVFEVNHATGVATVVAGNGTAGFSGDGGPASAAELYDPEGVAVDSSGHLFIADTLNDRIREVDLATGAISTVAGSGTWGFSGDGSPAAAAELGSPIGIAVDASGNLFIADSSNNCVREVDRATGIITNVAGNGTAGFGGDGGPATAAELYSPQGVAVDSSGDLFIADSRNNRIREVDVATGVITTVAGIGIYGISGDGGPAAAAELGNPQGIAVDSSQDLFIAVDNRIREVNHSTGVITTVAGNGTGGISGDGGPATAAELNFPLGVAVDSSGDLFIADNGNNCVREVNQATGVITTVAGNGSRGFSGDGSAATAAELESPRSIAIDSSGDLFIADGPNNRIREVNRATGVITTIVGNGTASFGGDLGPATAAELHDPEGVAVDSSGDLFIADTGNNCIREVKLATGVIATVAGNRTGGFSGDGGPATAAELNGPLGIAVDSSGNLFIADTGNNRIREVNHSTGVITTVAGNGTGGFSGDRGPATAAELNFPLGVAVNASGGLFFADAFNDRIRKVDLATGVINTVAGGGTAGLGDGGPATASELAFPDGVAVDSSGHLFIADYGSNRIRQIDLATGIITTLAGNGTRGYSGPAGAAELAGPAGVAVDSSGDLFIADKLNNRVREVSSGATAIDVMPATLTITVDNQSKAYGAALPALTASYSGFVNGDSAASLTTPPTLSTTATAGSPVSGSPYAITASGAVDTNYTIRYVAGALTVTPATLTVKANDASKAQGAPNPDFTDAITGFVNGDDASVVSGAASLTTTATTNSPAGDYPITAAAGTLSAANYKFAFQNGTLTVTTNSQGAFGLADDVYVIGAGTVSVSAADGVLANDSASGQLTVAAGAVTGTNGGTFTFHADGSFTYTPPANFPGFDSAQYTASDSQGHSAQATANALSQTGGVVWKFYEQVLHRNPDVGGLKYWINHLAGGGKTGDIAAGFFESDELLTEIITGYYQQYLNRAPDAGGLAHWKQVWHATGGPETIKAGFADSPEFYASAGGTPETWITELYRRILDREPDAQGKQFWLSYLTTHGNTEDSRKQIALRFFTSLEAYQGDVTGWFEEYLQRAPTASELEHYSSEMQAGKTDRDIEQEITNLPEYGQNPPATPSGAGVRLPNYFAQQASAVVAKDSLFARLGE